MPILPKVSIVIACFDDPDVVRAIDSAISQTYQNKEIIVVDDGSKDVVRKLLKKNESRINLLIHQPNKGQSIARNRGIGQSTGEYILNLDSDDFFDPTFCSKAVNKFSEDPNISIVTCQAQRFNKKGPIDVFTPRGGDLNNFLYANSALGSSMFKRSDWKRLGGYEEKLPILGIEDWEFYINILRNGGFAYVLFEPLFHYQVRKNSSTAQIRNVRHDKFKNIIIKHQDLYKDNFLDLITNLIEKIKAEEREKNKRIKSINFQLGKAVLKPFRLLRSFFM